MQTLLDQIGKTVRERLAEARLTPVEEEVRRFILREFAKNGRAPSGKAIMDKAKLPSLHSSNDILEKLHNADIITKDGDEIVSAYPFSARETRHRVIFKDGHGVYALCATDAVGIHFMLGESITVRSRCPECEQEMTVELKDEQAASSDPDGIIQFVGNSGQCGCTAKTFCPFMNFFCSQDHLDAWRRKNPTYGKGEQYSLQQTLEYGRHIFGDFLK